MKRVVILLLSAVFIISAAGSVSGREAVIRTVCDINNGACVAKTADSNFDVTFDITPKPVAAMRELVFQVAVKDKNGTVTNAAVKIELSMPGMYMGKNEIALTPLRDRYEGSGIIVRCPSGKKIWQADVIIRSQNKTAGTLFIFEVK